MKANGLILVFHPHRRPGWADLFFDRESVISAWKNGYYERQCFAFDSVSGDSFDDAIDDLGHDLNSLTVLNSRSEFRRYTKSRHHNAAHGSVREAAKLLGWL